VFGFFLDLSELSLPFRVLLWIGAWSLIAAAGAAAIALSVRAVRSAALRSLLWTAYFVTISIGPALDCLSPKPVRLRLHVALKQIPRRTSTIVIPALSPRSRPSAAVARPAARPAPDADTAGAPVHIDWALLAAAALLAGALISMGSVVLSWLRMRRLRGRATPLNEAAVARHISPVLAALGVAKTVQVRVTDQLEIPATHGFFRPVLLLPASRLEAFFERDMRGVLAHEIGHIKRLDFLRNCMAYVARAMYWFMAPVWLAHRALHREMELAADDMAITYTGDRRRYAEALGRLAIVCFSGRAAMACSLFLFRRRRKTILLRMQSALASSARTSGSSRLAPVAVWCCVCAILAAAATTGFTSARRDARGASLIMASEAPAPGLALRFPARQSIGRLREAPVTGAGAMMHEARGSVVLDGAKEYELELYPGYRGDLWFLRAPAARRITRLTAAEARFDPAQLRHLTACPRLARLDLSGSAITDNAVEYLVRMQSLIELRINRTAISTAGLAQLRKRLPRCQVVMHAHSAAALRAQGDRPRFAWPRRWRAFGTFDRITAPPDSLLRSVPRMLLVDGKQYAGVDVAVDEREWIDFESDFGHRREGKTVWLFAEVTIPEEMTLDIWAAADWWMSWHIDGIPVYSTREQGNQSTAYAYPNHTFSVRLSPGRHVVAVQVASGSRGWGLTSAAVPATAYQVRS
jgi:beta-lactamase regulating signal transducer with metallopeptidase domain